MAAIIGAVDVAAVQAAAGAELGRLLAKQQIQRPAVAIENGMLMPKSLDEQRRVAEMYLDSRMVPNTWTKDGDERTVLCRCVIAFMMAKRLGRDETWATQWVMFVNNRPSLWGDGPLDLVLSHPKFRGFAEGWTNLDKNGQPTDATVAWCELKREGCEPYRYEFSVADAKRAGLWGKSGPWTQYTKRQLQFRARGFGIRGIFADALGGACIAEEQQDIADASTEAANAAGRSVIADRIDELRRAETGGNATTEPAASPGRAAESTAPAETPEEREAREAEQALAKEDGDGFVASLGLEKQGSLIPEGGNPVGTVDRRRK